MFTRTREVERHIERERERDRCVRRCALGKEEGVRAKTKRVKMSSEKMAPFETVN